MKRATVWFVTAMLCVLVGAAGRAAHSQATRPAPQGAAAQPPRPRYEVKPPDGPRVFETDTVKVRVVPLARGLDHPWSLAFLPNGDMLVTERPGRLRIMRGGVLDSNPISGVPQVFAVSLQGLMGVALHPKFAENKLVYLAYSKRGDKGLSATALARGRLEGNTLTDVRDIFVTEPWVAPTAMASTLLFAPDGSLFMTVGGAINATTSGQLAQDPRNHYGKILRLRDDGSVPPDNPFIGRAGYKPEIYSMGHRNQLGLAIHPVTGALWESENGPQGGDEINIILPGRNYGWPVATYGREYSGAPITETPVRRDMESPFIFWVPSIGASGIAFYTGDRFPTWKGSLLVGGLSGRAIHRIRFNKNGWEDTYRPREYLLTDLKQRIRDVKQGPDGLVYFLTNGFDLRDDLEGLVMRIEPAEGDASR
ncbi:MAG TPA: PQQ-dependent sugar dehydrogenase [Vicinamibacterales bacterium]|nr:PQQ-dependent sugar dehydrogenase [Vicinamibacterales bacterium]